MVLHGHAALRVHEDEPGKRDVPAFHAVLAQVGGKLGEHRACLGVDVRGVAGKRPQRDGARRQHVEVRGGLHARLHRVVGADAQLRVLAAARVRKVPGPPYDRLRDEGHQARQQRRVLVQHALHPGAAQRPVCAHLLQAHGAAAGVEQALSEILHLLKLPLKACHLGAQVVGVRPGQAHDVLQGCFRLAAQVAGHLVERERHGREATQVQQLKDVVHRVVPEAVRVDLRVHQAFLLEEADRATRVAQHVSHLLYRVGPLVRAHGYASPKPVGHATHLDDSPTFANRSARPSRPTRRGRGAERVRVRPGGAGGGGARWPSPPRRSPGVSTGS